MRFFIHVFLLLLVLGTVFSAPEAEQQGKPVEVTLRVGYMPILPVAQFFIIDGLGWAAEEGIAFDMVRFPNGPAMVQAVASGDLDVMYFGIGPAMVARSRGQDIVVLASNIVEQIAFIADGKLAGYFNPNDPARMFVDFMQKENRPAKIATFPTGAVPHTVLMHWLINVLEIDMDTVEILTMGTDQVQQTMLAGNVDAAAILEPVLTVVQNRKPDIQVLARSESMFPKQPGAVLAVKRSVLEQYPEHVEKLVALHIRATDYLVNNPKQAAPIIQEFIGNGLIPVEILEQALVSPSTNYVSNPHAIMESTARMYNFQRELGSIQQEIDLDELFYTSVYDAVSK